MDHEPGPGKMEAALREKVRSDEAAFSASSRPKDTLWDHLVRVARIAERLGRGEGLDPELCRLAGLFHDAGKFAGGTYHRDERSEEEESVAVLQELATSHGIPRPSIDEAAYAIMQLYCDEPGTSPLAGVVFDADNLDKLGRLGVANYFIKAGLHGRGLSPDLLYRLTVELTYAHHAPDCFRTPTGIALAKKHAEETMDFYRRFLYTLREEGLFDFSIEEVEFQGLCLQVVAPPACACGGRLDRRVWSETGMKCIEVHLEHRCTGCGFEHRIRFCQPRLIGRAPGA